MAGDEGSAARDWGRVLRVKQGYNPNSSSVGSLVPVFLLGSLGAAAASVVLQQVLAEVAQRLRGAAPPPAAAPPAPPTADGAGSPRGPSP